MSSQRQIDANRRNAQHSTGPRTPEGRAAVSLNALRHGLSAETSVLPGEDPGEFQQLLDAFFDEHQPAGPTETLLVEQMAICAWRLRRMRSLETGLFNVRMSQLPRDENDLDPCSRAFLYDTSGSRSMEALSRYETRIERAFYRALHELHRLRTPSPPSDLPDPPEPPRPENDFANQTQSHNRTPNPAPEPDATPALAVAGFSNTARQFSKIGRENDSPHWRGDAGKIGSAAAVGRQREGCRSHLL